MTVPRILIAGCGDIGGRVARQLQGAGWEVTGARRTVSRLPEGVRGVCADFSQPGCPDGWPVVAPDYLVYAVAADQHDEDGYRRAYLDGLANVMGWLKQHGQTPRRLIFVSSSSVYGQTDGEWVDETSATQPAGYSGQVMLEAEALAASSQAPATVVRLTGIYGPGRERLINQARQGVYAAQQPPQYGNRIHADDAAGLIAHLLRADWAGTELAGCYLGVDDCPAALHEVLEWLCGQLGVAQTSHQAPLRRTGSKRCSNARARAIGWAPRYPSFREGYAELLQGMA
ncbi:SDR family oxidoreductase [Pseudomonas sp. RIT-PI-S]|uniref:SDR family oxidoreductase n=1 Tax=Pseudomonas sp. RIT-PI-S TaxID=3035295 RepID=UPI0021D9FD8F|nr:SDR family oxidoreductase [Pseudomonas sp. RIT-PI-S]